MIVFYSEYILIKRRRFNVVTSILQLVMHKGLEFVQLNVFWQVTHKALLMKKGVLYTTMLTSGCITPDAISIEWCAIES